MNIESHILNVLQFYEYAMAIGKSLDYKESCDLFLKLILKRKNLNAAWILKEVEGQLVTTYTVPIGKELNTSNNDRFKSFLNSIKESELIQVNEAMLTVSPFTLDEGFLAIFNLMEQGKLFLYTKKNNLTKKDLTQLQPVVTKFSVNLRACKAFEEQKMLLQNLETQNQELRDYAHMISHDLKSPLRSIDTLSAWLNEDYSDIIGASGQNQIQTIRENIQKIDSLIDGILDYSTLRNNQYDVYDINLNNLICEAIEDFFVPNHITITKGFLPIIKGDKFRLEQLFRNLLSNAINSIDKPKGEIEFSYRDLGNSWEFCVKDNGKGIDECYFDKIFMIFQKLENNVNTSGMGLAIAKRIVDIYGGDIWVTSKLGEGSTFYFTIKKRSDGET